MADRVRLLILAAACALSLGCTSAQKDAAPRFAGLCASPDFRAFDFWLGSWTIRQRILGADGGWIELPAATTVSASPDGCVLTEHWSGDVRFFWEGMTEPARIWGYSVRRFDPATATWAIYWMDSRKPDFDTPYVGGIDDGRGAFFRDFEAPDGLRRSRIVFERRSDDDVFWELAVSADGGATFAPIWTMDMRRAARP